MNVSNPLLVLLASSAMSLASAQAGSDSCQTPDPLLGQGLFPFDLTTATTGVEGQSEGQWPAPIHNDVWFRWTADASGLAVIGNCLPFPNHPTFDTGIAAYPDAGCPPDGTSLDVSISGCLGQGARIDFPVTAGVSYLLQVGSQFSTLWSSTTGAIEISIVPLLTNDDCSTPTSIFGQGLFPFNQIDATTGIEGQNEYCGSHSSGFLEDVWFDWTADVSGLATISTCGQATHDTQLEVFPGGGCPADGTSIVCADDGCGATLQSTVTFPVLAGTNYMVHLGYGNLGGMGVGNLEVMIQPLMTNDDCSTPIAIAGQGGFLYDNSNATSGTEGQSEPVCYQFLPGAMAAYKDLWYSWTADEYGMATVSTCGHSQSSKLVAYPGVGCPVDGTGVACSLGTCLAGTEISFPVSAGSTYTLQVGDYYPTAFGGAARFDISIDPSVSPGVPFCFCDSGSSPCLNNGASGNGCQNGTGPDGANLTGFGGPFDGEGAVGLSASGLIPGQPGLYFQGVNTIASGMGVLFGDGLRCVGGGLVRLGVVVSDAAGNSDTNGLAQSLSSLGGVSLGDLRHYQLWYRDPVGSLCGYGFNLTNGYTIQW